MILLTVVVSVFAQDITFIEHFLEDNYIQAGGFYIADLNNDGFKDITGCSWGGGGKVSWWQLRSNWEWF